MLGSETDEHAIERNDTWQIAVMNDLQFPQNLFPHRHLYINQHDIRECDLCQSGKKEEGGTTSDMSFTCDVGE